MISNPNHIVISRTDSIGDVCLTLPLAGILKEKFPLAKITFLGNTYTKPVIQCCQNVDEIWEWALIQQQSEQEQVAFLKEQKVDVFIHVFPRKELARIAKKAGIQHRIGTSHRVFHWLTCNHRPNFTRKNSELHEAQLNTKLLTPLGIQRAFTLDELASYAGFSAAESLKAEHRQLLSPEKINVICHPKSQGSAREWAIENYIQLARELDSNRYTIFFTGTEKEGQLFKSQIPIQHNIVDLTGKLTLGELIAFIKACNYLVAASTGPLHLAGLNQIHAIGLFAIRKPTHAGRWKPLGNNVLIIEEKNSVEGPQPLTIPLRDVMKALEQGA